MFHQLSCAFLFLSTISSLYSCGSIDRQRVYQIRGLNCSGVFPTSGDQVTFKWRVEYIKTGKRGEKLDENEPLNEEYADTKVVSCNAGPIKNDPYLQSIEPESVKCFYPLHAIDKAIMTLDLVTGKVSARSLTP